MGVNHSYLAAQPMPVQQGLAVFSGEYITRQRLSLQIAENFSLSGDDFTVKDVNTGAVWFKVDGKVLTMRQRKVLLDVRGLRVAELRHRVLSWTQAVDVFSAHDLSQPIFSARKKPTINFSKTTSRVTVRNLLDGSVVNITLLGDPRGKAGVLMLGEQHVIAKMRRAFKATELLGQQTYIVDIAPGVDVSFVTVMVVLWDEFAHDHHNGGGD